MLSPQGTVAGITALAIAIAEGKTSEEIAELAAVLTQLGDTLATIAIGVAKQELVQPGLGHDG